MTPSSQTTEETNEEPDPDTRTNCFEKGLRCWAWAAGISWAVKSDSPLDTACHIVYEVYMCFQCRWREVDTEEPPGAEASGAVGLHGPFQNKQRSPGGYQLTRTVRSPVSSAPLPPCPSPSPPSCQLSHQTARHTYHNHQPLSASCSGNRALWKHGPALYIFISHAHQHTYYHVECMHVFSHHAGLTAAFTLAVKHLGTRAPVQCAHIYLR